MKSIKDKQKEWKRQEIINAVIELSLKENILDISIEDIAKKSGFAKSSIYYYFNSKEEIIKEILKNGWKIMLSKIRSVQIDENEPLESLIKVIKAHLEFVQEQPKLFKFISKFTKALIDKEVKKYLEQENKIYLDLINSCIEKGIFKNELKFIYNSLAGSIRQIAQNEELSFEEKLNYILKDLEKFKVSI
ncbi:MAG: TetR/AcrR family transcriptional regulator [candidate division WOR-3 bacterium]|mgnify:CR=1 FL=1|jgi:AcrR family transcriptional regulator